jgi:hypothetical protein
VLDLLRTPRFVDLAPAEIYATLLDEGVHLCSIRTLYRILAENGSVAISVLVRAAFAGQDAELAALSDLRVRRCEVVMETARNCRFNE